MGEIVLGAALVLMGLLVITAAGPMTRRDEQMFYSRFMAAQKTRQRGLQVVGALIGAFGIVIAVFAS